jgi:hypothetical protein
LTIQCPVLNFIHRDLDDVSFKEKWAASVVVTIGISKVCDIRVCFVIEQLFLVLSPSSPDPLSPWLCKLLIVGMFLQ